MSNVGGMQRVAMELLRQLQRRSDLHIETLVLNAPWKGVALRAAPFILSLATRVPRRIQRSAIDTVLFSSVTTAMTLPLYSSRIDRSRVRLAAVAHGLDVVAAHHFYQSVVRRTLHRLDLVLPVSRATAKACIKRGAAAVEVVPNGVDLGRFNGVSRSNGQPAALHTAGDGSLFAELPEEDILLLSVGRQVARKGFTWFAENVAPELPPNVHWWHAGHGPERPALERVIKRCGLERRVRLLGLVDEPTLMALYERADLFVMPNIAQPDDMEGFGVVMLEAGACGVATVASELEGITDVVRNGTNGFLLPSGNAEAWIDQLKVIANDRTRMKGMGNNAAEFVRQTFDWPAIADRYVGALRNIGPGSLR